MTTPPESESFPPAPADGIEEEPSPGASTRWFAYIAVGITLVSLLVGLALLGGGVYLFLRFMR